MRSLTRSSLYCLDMNEQVRIYLNTKLLSNVNEIERLYREVEQITRLLRVQHACESNQTEPPIQPEQPSVSPLAVRPRLASSRSSPNIRDFPGSATEVHPAHRPSVPSQSRFPVFSPVSIKAECFPAFYFPLFLHDTRGTQRTLGF